MEGRNGTDDLYKFLFWVYMALFFVNLNLKIDFLDFLQYAIIFALFFRMLSKDVKRRQAENAAYNEIKNKVKHKFRIGKIREKNKDTHIYCKCPKCATALRLPYRVGTHKAKCPKCGEIFEVTNK